jgi:hypothetical protein
MEKKGHRLPEGEKRSIHSQDSLRFMTEEIGVGSWHEQLLIEGHRLEFTKEPGPYREDNNQSAKENMSIAREKVKKWVEQGSMKKLEQPAHCLNPLTVAAKYDPYTGEIKYRPCIDLSRSS